MNEEIQSWYNASQDRARNEEDRAASLLVGGDGGKQEARDKLAGSSQAHENRLTNKLELG